MRSHARTSATPSAQSRIENGFTLIDVLFVTALISMLSAIALPNLLTARRGAQSASALVSLRVIESAQFNFAITCASGFYAQNFSTLAKTPPGMPPFLPPDLGPGEPFIKSGYTFSMSGSGGGFNGQFQGEQSGSPATCNGLGQGKTGTSYAVVADPLDHPQNGGRFFGTNAEGVIYEHTSSLLGMMPVTGGPPSGRPIQ